MFDVLILVVGFLLLVLAGISSIISILSKDELAAIKHMLTAIYFVMLFALLQ